MKKCLLVLLALCLLLSGCAGKPASAPGTTDPVGTLAPTALPDGFVSSSEILSGGTQMTGVNLKEIAVTLDEEGYTRIDLTFMDGSEVMGIPEAAPLDVPSYTTDWFEGADRLILHLQGVLYWDYELAMPDLSGTLLQGLFQVQAGQDLGDLVFQIGETVEYAIQSEANHLQLTLRPTGEEQNNVYSIAISAYEARYGEGIAAQLGEMGLAPALCADGVSTMLVSIPFASQGEAEAYLSGIAGSLNKLLPDAHPEIVSYASNRLPVFREGSVLSAAAQNAVVSVNGEAMASDVLLAGGTYLCRIPDGSGYVYARGMDAGGDGEFRYEELILNRNGQETVIPEGFEFMSILSAQPSRDSRYLAVLEQTMELDLSVIHLETGEVFLPAEDGLWSELVSCCWHEKEPILYCLASNGDETSLYVYDLTDPSRPMMQQVGDRAWDPESITFAQGKIWCLQYDAERVPYVCSIDPVTTEIEYHEEAYTLSVEPGGRYYAALSYGMESAMSATLVDMATGETVYSQEGPEWIDMAWDASGEVLYVTTLEDVSSWEDEFPMTLSRVDIQKGTMEPWMRCKAGALYSAQEPGELWMLYIFSHNQKTVSATYIIR